MRPTLVSIEEYLASEACAAAKSEYLAGTRYAMVGGTNRHNQIATNVLGCLYSRLLGHACRPCNSDTRIRVRLPDETRFYYPDASVVSRPNAADELYQDHPVLIVEALSPNTRRIDEGEKKDAYLTIPSLNGYLMLEADAPEGVLYLRSDTGFVRREFAGLEATLPLDELGIELPLAEVYR